MKESEFDKKITEMYDEELQRIPVPPGLEDSLGGFIDGLDESDKRKNHRVIAWRWAASIAASLALIVSLTFYFTSHPSEEPLMSEWTGGSVSVIDDPEVAYQEYTKALAMVSTQWNKGMAQLDQAEESIEKSNQRINKTIKHIRK